MAGGHSPLILVVDDDAALGEMLEIVLRREGFDVLVHREGREAVDVFRQVRPALILLDLMLPGRSGIDVCREIRGESGVPIIMLTAKSDTEDVVRGLEAGADDYVSKPFKSQEVLARIRTRLRSVPFESTEPELTRGNITINVQAHSVTKDGEPVNVTPLEFDLLTTLFRHPDHVFTREQLLNTVWGYRHSADTRLVNVHVQRLRSKIEVDPENPRIVVTVRGVGYRAGDGTDAD